MAASIGASCLVAAGMTGLVGASLPRAHAAVARALAAVQVFLIGVATTLLAIAMLRVDGRYAEVADTTSRLTPWPYRLAGLWGGLRGSMLFFTFLLSVIALGVVRGATARRAVAVFISALAIASAVVANPFALLRVPAIDGGGLTPVLRHPAMLIHPPLLYTGLALLIGAAFCRIDSDSAPRAPLVAGAAVMCVALALGSWWASAELGWVGLWAWDPIENAGLVPLLLAIAAIHGGPAHSPRRLTTALVLLAGWTAFAGTVLTRSGAALSVHAFADAQRLGRVLSAITLVLLFGGVSVVLRAQLELELEREPSGATARRPVAAVALGLLCVAAVVISAGTIGPLVREVLGGEQSVVQGTFFARWTAPIAVVALFALAFAGRASPRSRRRLLVGEGTALAVAAAAFPIWRSPWVCLVSGLAVWSIVVPAGRLRAPVAIAHLGLALTIAGAVLSGAGGSVTAPLRPGQVVTIEGWSVGFDRLETVRLADRDRVIARTSVLHDGSPLAVLHPSLDRWNGTTASLAESATTSWRGVDLQLVLRTIRRDAGAPAGAVVLEVHVRRLIRLAWWGPVLMAAGLVWTELARRRRRRSALPVIQTTDAVIQNAAS